MICGQTKIVKIGKVEGVFVCIFFLLFALSTDGRRRQRSHLRIHQGKSVSHQQYPFVMVLVIKLMVFSPKDPLKIEIIAKRICTCSLIKRDWVLIAAHCLREIRTYGKDLFRIVYGDLTIPLNITPHETTIERAVPHPNFVDNLGIGIWRHDIALLMIKPVDLTLGKLSGIDYKALIGLPVKFLGAGGTHSLQSELQGKLKKIAETEVLDQTRPLQMGEAIVVKCDPRKTILFQAAYPGICLHSKCSSPSQSVIPGDSGGPLLFKDKIVGIASLTGLGAVSHQPPLKEYMGPSGAVYTPISPYLDWINRVTNDCIEQRSKKDFKNNTR